MAVKDSGQAPGGDMRLSPFKFLDPYGPEDAALFFGRAFETAELYSRLYSGPVTVVYGESGTGKTSLIQCGLRNRVPAEDMLFVSVRTALDPETTLGEELQKLVAPAEGGSEDLNALIRRVIRRSYKTVLLVFDQFEELFLFQPEELRQALGRRLPGWLDAGLNLRLLFAIREEYLARLTELEEHLPGLYENRLRLRRMSRERVEEAIVEPCRAHGATIEPGLVTALLDSLRVGGQDVELPILQVVLDTLYRQAVQQAGPAPVLTLQSYRDLGEARLILARFVDDRLAAYAGEAETARQALKALVTLEGTRRLAAAGEIPEQLLGFGIELTEDGVLSLLRRLVNDRILREDPERHLFELRHDALAPHIREWMSGIEQDLADLRQILTDRLREYRQRGRLLEREVIADLAPYEDRLRLRGELAELVDRSKRRERWRQRRQMVGFVSAIASTVMIVVYITFTYANVILHYRNTPVFYVVIAIIVIVYYSVKPRVRNLEQEHDAAQDKFRRARQFVDSLVYQASESALLNQPKFRRLRRQLLERALLFYHHLTTQRAQDQVTQEEREDANFRLAKLQRLLGDMANIEDTYHHEMLEHNERVALDEQLVREHPEVPDYKCQLARSYKALGDLQASTSQRTDAQDSYRKYIGIYQHLARRHPELPEYRRELARSYDVLGVMQASAGCVADAESTYIKAIDLWENLARKYSELLEYQRELARSYDNLGLLQTNIGCGVEVPFKKAADIYERLARAHPEAADYRNNLARSYYNLGVLRSNAGRMDDAEASYNQAIVISERLAREHPDVSRYQHNLARSYYNLGELQARTGRRTHAEASYKRTADIYGRLSREHVEWGDYKNNLAMSYRSLGKLQVTIGRTAEAEASYTQALGVYERLIGKIL